MITGENFMIRRKDDKMTKNETERRARKVKQWREFIKTTTFVLAVFTVCILWFIYAFKDGFNFTLIAPALIILAIMYAVSGYGYLQYRKWKI